MYEAGLPSLHTIFSVLQKHQETWIKQHQQQNRAEQTPFCMCLIDASLQLFMIKW